MAYIKIQVETINHLFLILSGKILYILLFGVEAGGSDVESHSQLHKGV